MLIPEPEARSAMNACSIPVNSKLRSYVHTYAKKDDADKELHPDSINHVSIPTQMKHLFQALEDEILKNREHVGAAKFMKIQNAELKRQVEMLEGNVETLSMCLEREQAKNGYPDNSNEPKVSTGLVPSTKWRRLCIRLLLNQPNMDAVKLAEMLLSETGNAYETTKAVVDKVLGEIPIDPQAETDTSFSLEPEIHSPFRSAKDIAAKSMEDEVNCRFRDFTGVHPSKLALYDSDLTDSEVNLCLRLICAGFYNEEPGGAIRYTMRNDKLNLTDTINLLDRLLPYLPTKEEFEELRG